MSFLSKTSQKIQEEPDIVSRMKELEHKVTEDLMKIDMRLNNLEKVGQESGKQVVQSPDLTKFESRLSDLEHLVSSFEVNLLKNGEHPNIAQVDNRPVETKLASIENNLENILKRVNALEVQKALLTPGNNLPSVSYDKLSGSVNIDQNISTLIQNLKNELDVLRIRDKSVDTNIVKIEERVKDYLEGMNHKLDLKIIDIEEKLDKAFEHVPGKDDYEKNVELRVINLLSDKIEHFAQMLDKKLLDFPTKNEVEKKLVRLEGMVAKLERPDMSSVSQRLDSLEMKLDDLIRSHQEHSRRIPLVVQ